MGISLRRLGLPFLYIGRLCVMRVAQGHQPTEPSRFASRSLVASTANSKGNCLNTSLQKPLMMSEWASSVEMPR